MRNFVRISTLFPLLAIFAGACSILGGDDGDDSNLLGLAAFLPLSGLVIVEPGPVPIVPGTVLDMNADGRGDWTALDTNSDGVADGLDLDGDGVLNLNLNSSNGALGTFSLDINGDGVGDYPVVEMQAGAGYALLTELGAAGRLITVMDSNGDGKFDSLDTNGNGMADVFLAENNYYMGGNVLTKLNLAGGVSVFAGSAGATGATNAVGTAARFNEPIQITQKNGFLYVTDFQNGSLRHIRISDADVNGPVTGETSPVGIAPLGANFYYTRLAGRIIKQWDGSSASTSTFAGSGANGSTDAAGTAASFGAPWGIASNGFDIFVTENGNATVRRITAAGVVTTIVGSSGAQDCVDGTGSAARFKNPAGITTDGRHLYVSDTNCCTIRRITFDTNVVTTFAGTANDCSSLEGTGTAAKFNTPTGLSTDGTYLYVVEINANKVRRINLSTAVTETLATGFGFGANWGSDSVSNGSRLFVADRASHVIRVVD